MTPDQFNLPPEQVTTGQLFMLMQSMNARMLQQNAELVRIRERIERQESATRDIVSAWKAGGTVLTVVKIIGSVALAITATWALLKGWRNA